MSRDALKLKIRALAAESETLKSATHEALAEEIAATAAALALESPTAAPATRPDLFTGRWALLFSTFKLERQTDLGKLSFGKLPAAPVTVVRLFQEIWPDMDAAYDNIVELTDAAGRPLRKVMTGQFNAHEDSRFDVVFSHVFTVADDGRDQAGLARDLGLDAGASLSVAIGKTPPLHSNIIYLDADMRIMRGVYGGVYVLERAPDPGVRARTLMPAA